MSSLRARPLLKTCEDSDMATGDRITVEAGPETKRILRGIQTELKHHNDLYLSANGVGGPTWEEILEAKSLLRDGVIYTVITQGDEGYIRVEAKKA